MSDEFFDFEWGATGLKKAHLAQKQLKTGDADSVTVTGVMIACVVNARGRKMSPSSMFESLIKSKRRTNPSIVDHIIGAWNILSDQSTVSQDRLDVLTELISPKHRNKTGISETLRYQLEMTYESMLDLWVVMSDFLTGFRSMTNKVFTVTDTVNVPDYLSRGMTRSQLLQAFGHELKPADDEPDDEENEEE